MTISTLILAGVLIFGQGAAADQRPYAASRADAVRTAATRQSAQAPVPEATTVRYPSVDGDILAGLGEGMTVPPLKPARPITAVFPPTPRPSAEPYSTDTSGLLGGPRH